MVQVVQIDARIIVQYSALRIPRMGRWLAMILQGLCKRTILNAKSVKKSFFRA